MDQGILWTSFMDVPQDDNRMGIHSAAAALHISSSFDQRHAELAPPRSAYPPSLHPFSPSPGAGLAQPTLLFAANYGVAPPKLRDGGRGGLPILIPLFLSFLPPCLSCLFLLCTQISPLDGFLSLSLPPFSSSSCAVQQQQEASISSAQLAELDRSRTVLFTTRNSPSLSRPNPLIIICHRHLNRNLSLSPLGKMRHEGTSTTVRGEEKKFCKVWRESIPFPYTRHDLGLVEN